MCYVWWNDIFKMLTIRIYDVILALSLHDCFVSFINSTCGNVVSIYYLLAPYWFFFKSTETITLIGHIQITRFIKKLNTCRIKCKKVVKVCNILLLNTLNSSHY